MKTKLFLCCLFLWLLTMPMRADENLYHFVYGDIDIYIANQNIGATDSDEVGTLFTSITNEQVEELYGSGWRLPTHVEMSAIVNHCSEFSSLFPLVSSSYYNSDTEFSRFELREYWVENDEYLYTYYYASTRFPAVYECAIVHSGYWNERYGDSGQHAVRPVLSANYLGIDTAAEIPHPVATYDLQGRPSTQGKGMRVEVLNNGKTRMVIVR